MRLARSLVVLAVWLPAAAGARPLMDATPTPSPTATPEVAATPAAEPSSTPAAEPSATPAVEPSATPTPEVAAPLTSPEPSATPAPEAAAEPGAPVDYTAGMPGSAPGSRRVRAGVELGIHVFAGQGWDRKATPPPNPQPAFSSSEYVGGSLVGFALYDLTPILALSGSVGGHNGTHGDDTGIAGTHVTTALNAWYASAGLRLQTPADIVGVWLEGGAGAYLGRRVITTKTSTASRIDAASRAGITAHASAGVLYHLAQGLDVFAETRWMTLPGRFGTEPALDLGGFTALAGASLRL